MAKKFIIQGNTFLYGNVEMHYELKQENYQEPVLGGGYYVKDTEKNILYLYGKSQDFGQLTIEQISKVYTQGNIPDELQGYLLLFSTLDQFSYGHIWHTVNSKREEIEETKFHDYPTEMTDLTNLRNLYPNPKKIPPLVREEPKIGRNSRCACGSGKKYKHCCIK